MLEKFSEFSLKRKQIKDKKKQLKRQLFDLGKQNLEVKKQEIQKSMNKYVNGPSGFSKF